MDEVRRFCIRMLGDGPAARSAAEAASAAGGDRLAALCAAVSGCRRATPTEPVEMDGDGEGLAAAVARELAAATAHLPASEREALALADLLGLSYDEIAAVTGAAQEDIALLLAHARIRLREQLRGIGGAPADCAEHDRALRAIAARQDGQPVPAADEEWLIEHLGHCRGCAGDHAGMLEAAACYRAWATAEGGAVPVS
jgi:hypothetical protein